MIGLTEVATKHRHRWRKELLSLVALVLSWWAASTQMHMLYECNAVDRIADRVAIFESHWSIVAHDNIALPAT